MRGRVLKIALISWVATLLVAPAAAYVLGVRSHANENRALATVPPLSIGTIVHSGAWHRAAAAFSDHLPLRDRMIRWRAEVEFNVFSDSPNPSVVIVGRNHWLFLHEEFDVCSAWPTVQPLWVAQAFELAYAAAKASGRELRILIIPAKSTIEADHYRSSHYSFEGCARAREQRLEALLRGQPGVVDLWSALRAAKRRGGDLWLENDSHTDTAGSIVIARSLVRSLRETAWQEGVETSGAEYGYSGDLGVLAGIPTRTPRHKLVLHGRPSNPIRAPLLALSDSQLEASDPEILPYFPARRELSIDLLGARGVPAATIRAARILVLESVVRTAYERVAFGLPAPLIDALLPDIRSAPAAFGAPQQTTSSTLTLTGAPTTLGVRAAHDDAHSWRLLVIDVRAAPQLITLALVDPSGHALTTPSSARVALPAPNTVALAIPPGVSLAGVRVAISAPGGATLSAPRLARLPTAPRGPRRSG
jgi:hypothetical protein